MRWLNLIGSVQSTELHFVSRPGIKARIHTILGHVTRRVGNRIRPPVWIFKFLNRAKDQFECPLCNYKGPFMDLNGFAGFRRHARCPKCQSLERHRLQYLAVSDLLMRGVDHKVDLQNLPFEDATYDFVFASHVLEHIPDDKRAIREIRRIIKPRGVAILPVPVVCEKTIEYPQPNPDEAYHVRAPGFDYFDRYGEYFSRVALHTSDSFPERYQLFIYEYRSAWPTLECPLRPPMPGERHADVVPICYV